MRPSVAVAIAVACAAVVPTDAEAGRAAHVQETPPIVLPQARIDAIDVSEFPKVRVLATVLDRLGRPLDVKAIKKLEVLDGKRRQAEPYAEFVNGVATGERKDAVLKAASKAKVKHSAVVVVLGHRHKALGSGSLGPRVKDSLQPLFKAFGKTDRVNVIFYNDRIYSLVQLKGRSKGLSDLEFMRNSKVNCGHARDEAISGRPITLGDPGKEFAPGTDLCGLAADAKTVLKRTQSKAFEGYFPRLFNLGRPFFEPKRYCAPPKEALGVWGEFSPENYKEKAEKWTTDKEKGLAVEWTTSAFDEALKMMMRDGRPDEQKSIIIISDGRDGYLNELDLCRRFPPKKCAQRSSRRLREACVRESLKAKLVARQTQFRDKAVHWIGIARASGIRIFGVGLAMLGEAYDLERIRLLAERTGGTYRQAETEGRVGSKVDQMAREVLGQVVIDFEHQAPDEAGEKLSLKLKMKLDRTMFSGNTKQTTRPFKVAIPARRSFKDMAVDMVTDVLVSFQEAVGYKWYVIIGITVIVIFTILFLLISFFVIRGIFRLLGRIFGSKEEE